MNKRDFREVKREIEAIFLSKDAHLHDPSIHALFADAFRDCTDVDGLLVALGVLFRTFSIARFQREWKDLVEHLREREKVLCCLAFTWIV